MQKMTKIEAELLGKALRQAYANLGFSTQLSIERLVGVDQTQVSRVLRGDFRKLTDNVTTLCKYADIEPSDVIAGEIESAPEQQGRDRIMLAFDMVWDGTKEHAEAIAHLILATRRLSSRHPLAGPHKNKRG